MATLIVLSVARPGEETALQEYVEQVMPLLFDAGGAVVKRIGISDTVAGGPDTGFIFIMDFDSAASMRTVFDSDEYAALIPIRDKAFTQIDILITEDLPPAGAS